MRRVLVVLAGALLVVGAVAPLTVNAASGQTLDVDGPPNDPSGEIQSVAQGGSVTLSANLTSGLGTPVPNVNIDFEIEKGPNDTDGGFAFPVDLSCTTDATGNCSVQYTDDPNNNPKSPDNVDQIRAWTDDDGNDSTIEADLHEGPNELNPNQAGDVDEPDWTDVVQVEWVSPNATRLDVEPDSVGAVKGGNQTFTATATTDAGNPASGARVDYRIGNNPPVHACDTGSDGTCGQTLTSSSATTQTIRWWIDNGDDIPTEADMSEGRNERTTAGDKKEPDNTDVTEVQWRDNVYNLDVTPEQSSAKAGDSISLNALLKDAAGNPISAGVVDFVVQSGPDKGLRASCTTDPTGACSASMAGSGGDKDVILAWYDVNNNGFAEESDGAEGVDDGEFAQPGSQREPDGTDVVEAQFTGFCPGHHNDTRNQIVGTEKGEVLVGTAGADVICGLGGPDTLKGKDGDDVLLGNDGNDVLAGGPGNDVGRGGNGNDQVNGGPGNDRLFGQAGNDRFDGGKGQDVCNQGAGTGKRVSC